MSDLFSGLESLGLNGLSKMEVFEKKKEETEKKSTAKAEPAMIKEEDVIYDKAYVCPVCDREFKAKCVKTGKVRIAGSDQDLRPKYIGVDTLKYDAVLCPVCGYATLTRYFGGLTSGQAKLIRASVSNNFRGVREKDGPVTYDDAIMKHKMALVCAIVKKAKSSERAYICLKLAWLLRGKAESLPAITSNREEIVKDLHAQELEALGNAYEGFMDAFSKENFPMCGMDEMTVTYLSAVLAKETEKYDESMRLLARVITSREAKDKIKDKARELKDEIKEIVEK